MTEYVQCRECGRREWYSPGNGPCPDCGSTAGVHVVIEEEIDECAHGRFPGDCDECIAALDWKPPFCPGCHGEHLPYCKEE